MRPTRVLTLTLCTLLSSGAAVNAQQPGKAEGPCEQVIAACKSAGFIEGDYKTGKGLHMDCIDPIMKGGAQPPTAKIPLPKVSPDVVTACKQKRPNFGEPKKAPASPAAPAAPAPKS
jgi:hypothetical protein